ncbi:Proline--tRNA ligase [Galdieria sulphuraria]|nr:Proline--tRNA ligase [Galdieria sulphuraria]
MGLSNQWNRCASLRCLFLVHSSWKNDSKFTIHHSWNRHLACHHIGRAQKWSYKNRIPVITFSCLATDVSSKSDNKITPRSEDYSAWYLHVIQAAQLADQSAVKGCLVIRPYGYAVWELLRDHLDKLIKETEAEHVEGFAKECAVVTHHRLRLNTNSTLEPDPEAMLEEPLIVRPTSETLIWNMFQKWISSYRDLPLCINQWANVVRWELRTRPFLRTTEFLWQEGHTAHTNAKEAMDKAKEMLNVYTQLCEELLAIPVIKGCKSPSERFAGAEETFTIEAMMQNGWALQSVYYTDTSSQEQLVWATSWGASTRLLGALIMTHSDDIGLVLPPKVAPIQVIIIPIWKSQVDKEDTLRVSQKLLEQLKGAQIRAKLDDRDYIRPGSKYFEWERKGIPLRIEIGPRDVVDGVVTIASRIGNQKKYALPCNESLTMHIQQQLENMQRCLFQQAKERMDSRTFRNKQGFFLVPWKCNAIHEERIKAETKATIRCYPFDMQHLVKNEKCFYSGEPATHMALFARAY